MQVTYHVRFALPGDTQFYARIDRTVDTPVVPTVKSKLQLSAEDDGASEVVDVVYCVDPNVPILVYSNCTAETKEQVDEYMVLMETRGWELHYNPDYDQESREAAKALQLVKDTDEG